MDGSIGREADKVFETSKKTGTLVVVREDDQIKEVPLEELESRIPEKAEKGIF